VVVTVWRSPVTKSVEPFTSTAENSRNTGHGLSSSQVNPNVSSSAGVQTFSSLMGSCAESSSGNRKTIGTSRTRLPILAGELQ